MFSKQASILIATAFIVALDAAVIPSERRSVVPTIPPSAPYYTVTSQDEVDGTPWNGAPQVGVGGTLTYTKTHDVSVSVDVGADLGLDFGDIFSAGVSGSVSTDTANGSEESAQYTCPTATQGDQMQCSLMVTPHMLSVSGTQRAYWGATDGYETNPYTVLLPRVNDDGNAFLAVDLCVCGNVPGWASLAPPAGSSGPAQRWPVCPQDC
ncbi:hypothetical protein LTR08_003696 [Meristemomyces frigidus]|nr:hypothetical protein LTR08_003696 [Meristemomyces frigidus]